MSHQDRRSFLKAGISLPVMASLFGTSPLARAAEKASGGPDDYKALVCVYLAGGMDGHDTLIPAEGNGYDDWAKTRASLLGRGYRLLGKPSPRTADRLLPLAKDGGGRLLALPPEMTRTAAAFAKGEAAVVANVGALRGSVDLGGFRAASSALPPRLFSHLDQRDYWRRLGARGGVATGWGGRLTSQMDLTNPFSAIAAGRPDDVLTGPRGAGLTLAGTNTRKAFGVADNLWGSPELAALLTDHYADAASTEGILEADFAALQGRHIDTATRASDLFASTRAGEELRDGNGKLSHKMAIVAKAIALRGEAGVKRQVFVVELGGFDTHTLQHQRIPHLQYELDRQVGRFMDWVREQGLADAVTVFTGSEFGRTLEPNDGGTDHGWGSNAIVWGGAVIGGKVYGEAPPPVTGHGLDTGRGRVIPGLAHEQMFAPLMRWFGVPKTKLIDVLPYGDRFDLNAVRLIV